VLFHRRPRRDHLCVTRFGDGDVSRGPGVFKAAEGGLAQSVKSVITVLRLQVVGRRETPRR